MKYTDVGLVEYVKHQLEVPTYYVYGTFGRILTKQLIEAKIKQYPGFYNSDSRINNVRKQVGKKGFDCVGLIKGYYWDDAKYYNVPVGSDTNAGGLFSKSSIRGPMSTLPEHPGVCLYMDGHVGVYIGNKEVVECTIGWNSYKVIKTKLSDRKWKNWFQCSYIKYEEPIDAHSYKVIKGDYLIKIGKKLNILWTDIAKKNNIKFPWIIKVGQILKLPEIRYYTVIKGDNLNKIAKKLKVSWQDIYENNKETIGKDPNKIQPGQVLVIK